MGRCRDEFLTQVAPMKMDSDYLRLRELLVRNIKHLHSNHYIPFVLPSYFDAKASAYQEDSGADWQSLSLKRSKDMDQLKAYLRSMVKVRKKISEPKTQAAVDQVLRQLKAGLKIVSSARQREPHCSVMTVSSNKRGTQVHPFHYQPGKGYVTQTTARADFKIYNTGRRFSLERDDCAMVVTQAQYNHLQELGATLRVDQALTARLIGHIGKYRLSIEKKAFQFGVHTQHFDAKSVLCDFVTKRLRELQHVESSYGQGREQVKAALVRYIERLKLLQDGYLDELQDNIHVRWKRLIRDYEQWNEIMRYFYTHYFEVVKEYPNKRELFGEIRKIQREAHKLHREIRKLQWVQKIIEEQFTAVEADLAAAEKFLQQVTDRSPLANGLDITHKLQSDAAKQRYGNDAMKYSVGEWVRERCYSIGRFAKRSNELITLSGAATFGRGEFQSAYAEFDYECSHYEFSQNRALTPAHQGWFNLKEYDGINKDAISPADFFAQAQENDATDFEDIFEQTDTSKRTVRLSDLAHGRREVRDTLFAFSLVHHQVDMDKDCDDGIKEVISRGWQATRWREKKLRAELDSRLQSGQTLNKRQQVMNCYYSLRENIGESQEKRHHAFVKGLKSSGRQIKDMLVTVKDAIVNNFKALPEKIKRDFRYDQTAADDPISIEQLIKSHESTLVKAPAEIDRCLAKVAAARQAYSEQYGTDGVSVANDHYMQYMMHALSEQNPQTVPVFMAPYSFHAWKPRTPLSLADDMIHDVGGLLEIGFERSPLTWSLAGLAFTASGFAATSPAMLGGALSKLGLSDSSIKAFVTYNQCIAKALSANPYAQFTAVGLNNMQIMIALLDTLQFGGDAVSAKFLSDLRYHAPAAMMVLILAYLAGFGLREGNIPFLSDALSAGAGEMPFMGDLVVGLNGVGLAAEGLQRNVDERSVAANVVSTGMNLVINICRVPFALLINPLAAMYFLIRGKKEKAAMAAKNTLRPIADLADTVIRIVVSVVDFTLRALSVIGSVIKKIIKAPFEGLLNLAANLTPNYHTVRQVPLKNGRSIDLAKLAQYDPEAAEVFAEFLSKENDKAHHEATYESRYTVGSESILRFKSYIGKQFDKLARPLNNISRIVRNFYARLRTRDEMHFGDKPATNVITIVKAFEVFLERNGSIAKYQAARPHAIMGQAGYDRLFAPNLASKANTHSERMTVSVLQR